MSTHWNTEAATLGALLQELRAAGLPHVLVIDDLSDDGTGDIARASVTKAACGSVQINSAQGRVTAASQSMRALLSAFGVGTLAALVWLARTPAATRADAIRRMVATGSMRGNDPIALLIGEDAYVADQLFATLDPTVRRLRLPGGTQIGRAHV